MSDLHQAVLTIIAAQLEVQIADQQLKRAAIMRNRNTLRRLLAGRDVYLSHLIEAADGVNCEIEIILKRKA